MGCQGEEVVQVVDHPQSYMITSFCYMRCECLPASSGGRDGPARRAGGSGGNKGISGSRMSPSRRLHMDKRNVLPSRTLQVKDSLLRHRSPVAKDRDLPSSATRPTASPSYSLRCGEFIVTHNPHAGSRCEDFMACDGARPIQTAGHINFQIWDRCRQICTCVPRGGRPPLYPPQSPSTPGDSPSGEAPASGTGQGPETSLRVMQDLSRLRVPINSARNYAVRHPSAPSAGDPTLQPSQRTRLKKRGVVPAHSHQVMNSLISPRSPAAKNWDRHAPDRPLVYYLRCQRLRIQSYPEIGDRCEAFMACSGSIRTYTLQVQTSLICSTLTFFSVP